MTLCETTWRQWTARKMTENNDYIGWSKTASHQVLVIILSDSLLADFEKITFSAINLQEVNVKDSTTLHSQFLYKELISYRYQFCSSCSCWGDHLQKSPRLHHFKSDRVEILQDCPSSKYASVDGVGYFYMTSHFQDRGHDVISRNKVLPPGEWTRSVCRRLCNSVRQFLF